MLFRQDILQGIADGRVTLAFRRWQKAPPAAGSTLRTPVGVLSLGPVTIIDESDITPDDVRRTGMSPDALRASLAGEGTLLRMELRLIGDDPRIALREQRPGDKELADPTFPEWWSWDLSFTGHAELRMEQRGMARHAGDAAAAMIRRDRAWSRRSGIAH